MNVKLPKNLIIFCSVFFIVTGLSINVIGQEEKSILNRIQRIENPELGELIRIALENIPEAKELAAMHPSSSKYKELKSGVENLKLQTVRKVTEEYSEIKLLDSQIEQIEKRISLSKSPETLANELFLAKTELEAKLTNKLAELREIMNIIPIHPLGRRSVEQLKTWIKLDVIGDQVEVFTCSKPFYEYDNLMKHKFIKLMSHKETFDYVTNNIKTLPIRIDILRNTEGIKLSEELNKQIIDFIKEKNLEMQAEVHLDDEIRTQSLITWLIIQDGKIGRDIPSRTQRIGNNVVQIRELSSLLDINEVEDWIQYCTIRLPGLLPREFLLRHDEESKELALSVEKIIKDIAQKAGVEKVVTVKMEIYHLEDDQ